MASLSRSQIDRFLTAVKHLNASYATIMQL